MPPLNQTAPPAAAPKGDFLKLPPFPKSDTLVLTIVAFNYIHEHVFDRTDEKTGREYQETKPALELFFGTRIGDKCYFCKPWPIPYSLHEKANYAKWYEAANGKKPEPGSNPADIIGKYVMGGVKVENKTGSRGTAYTISKLTTVAAVPSILANTGIPVEVLKPELEKLLADGAGDANKTAGGGNPY